ncbi:PAAR domain-containing protein [Massilia sp. PAMC28688]|uniref:PAAR domain-containing protein n=1 Tax=Massilia sp. PAMC28688 TaxID=2861283 RepID=UPI001C62E120|nr:PAAR domain-containing protein [Massilia sp. PAMC28688]QYF95210.1 PAAR domain-containing protein [Massilia sp. PAMC28688]
MPEIIRQGDPTSHGGEVLEGSMTDICHGKPIAYMGHKVSCPQCKGTFPIIEGVLTTTFYGRGVALAGMKTACGAALIATQFTDTVEWTTGVTESTTASAIPAARPSVGAPAQRSETKAARPEAAKTATEEGGDAYDEQPALPRLVAEGIPYLIVTASGMHLSGLTDVSGKLPRIPTDGEEEYEVFWGDEALARMEG